MGFLGTRSTLIPFEMVRVNDARQVIKVAADKQTLKNGPTFDDEREITPQFENEVYSYYSLQRTQTIGNTGSYGSYYSDEGTDAGTVGPGMSMGDTETGQFREHAAHDEGVHQSRGDDLADEDELRVQRAEEELIAGTRQREAGSIRVRKRVRTDRERIEVPTRHEEVSVERVPLEAAAPLGFVLYLDLLAPYVLLDYLSLFHNVLADAHLFLEDRALVHNDLFLGYRYHDLILADLGL